MISKCATATVLFCSLNSHYSAIPKRLNIDWTGSLTPQISMFM